MHDLMGAFLYQMNRRRGSVLARSSKTENRRGIQLPLRAGFDNPQNLIEIHLTFNGTTTNCLRNDLIDWEAIRKLMIMRARKALLHCIRVPFYLLLIVIGFMLEYLVELPFNVMTRLDGRRRLKRD